MKVREVREKYLKFFEARGHKVISPAKLVLENDPTTLFTSSGMQPLIPYLTGEPHPEGKRVCDSQPSIRTQDIEEVGDRSHTTFFEMLGNWSFGDPDASDGVGAGYFKKEQLAWFWEFITEELRLPKDKLWVSVFEGNKEVPRDDETKETWKRLGIPEERIVYYGVEKNWWSRSGTPDKMPAGEIGGPDSEVFFEFSEIIHDLKYGDACHPNCDCGRFMEIGNSVFIQYKKLDNGKLEELPQKNVDFGGGLERLAAATINSPDVFKIDVFDSVIKKIEEITGKKYEGNEREFRVIADHMRAAVFLMKDGVIPCNKGQGYVLRRLTRRMVVKMKGLEGDLNKMADLVGVVISGYQEQFDNENEIFIVETLKSEVDKFKRSLDKGLREAEKINEIDGVRAFDLYQTYGFPLELTREIFEEKGQKIDREEFEKAFNEHKEKSRTASAGTFKGGLADHSEVTTKLHTATHLLQAALRQVLGEHVTQKGSNITHERLRFDFNHDAALTEDEKKKIIDLVNEQIDKKLPVTKETMGFAEAQKTGALANFGERYGEQVHVYTIGPAGGQAYFSREVCGGPHVSNLSEMGGHVRIIKEKSASAGVRRVYAVVE